MSNQKIDMGNPKIAYAMKMVSDNAFMLWNQIEIEELTQDRCVASVRLRPEQKNPNGFAHGGFLFTIADVAASTLARADGRNYVTLDSHVSFLQNVRGGVLYGRAAIVRRGRTSVLVEVKLQGEEGQELARVLVTMFCIGTVVS